MTTDKVLEATVREAAKLARSILSSGRSRPADAVTLARALLSVSPVEQQQQESSRERVLEEARNVCIAFKAELGTLPAYIADLEAALQGSALPKAQSDMGHETAGPAAGPTKMQESVEKDAARWIPVSEIEALANQLWPSGVDKLPYYTEERVHYYQWKILRYLLTKPAAMEGVKR